MSSKACVVTIALTVAVAVAVAVVVVVVVVVAVAVAFAIVVNVVVVIVFVVVVIVVVARGCHSRCVVVDDSAFRAHSRIRGGVLVVVVSHGCARGRVDLSIECHKLLLKFGPDLIVPGQL